MASLAFVLSAVAGLPSQPVSAQSGLDWTSLGAAVADHDAGGVHAMVPAPAGGATTLHEVWAPTLPGATILVPTGGGPVAAIGVTSPHDQLVVDVRVWHVVDRSPIRVEPVDVAGAGPAGERLLVPPSDLSSTGVWPSGTYRLDLLVGRRVLSITMVLPAPSRDPAVDASISKAAAAVPEGPFSVTMGAASDAVEVQHLDMASGVPLSAAMAWLDATANGGAQPRTAILDGDRSVVAVGLRGAPGEHITNAVLFNQSPPIIPIRTTAATITASAGGDVAVFDPGPAGVRPGVYRIDSSWIVDGQPAERTWHLDIRGPHAQTAAPPLLEAARRFSGAAGHWQVLGDGVPVSPQSPSAAPRDLATLGPDCRGGSRLAAGESVIGIGHAGAPISDVTVERLLPDGNDLPTPVAASLDPVAGLVLLTPSDAPTWSAGTYQVTLLQGGRPQYLVVCLA